jgi:hypothetical protein
MYDYVSLATYEQNGNILKVSRIGSSNNHVLFGILEVKTMDFIFLTVNPQNITGSVQLVFQANLSLLPVVSNFQFTADITATATILLTTPTQ